MLGGGMFANTTDTGAPLEFDFTDRSLGRLHLHGTHAFGMLQLQLLHWLLLALGGPDHNLAFRLQLGSGFLPVVFFFLRLCLELKTLSWVGTARTHAVNYVGQLTRHGRLLHDDPLRKGLVFRLANFGELNFVRGRNMIALYNVLFVAVNREPARRASLEAHLIVAVAWLSIRIACLPSQSLLLFDFGVGRGEVCSLVVREVGGWLLNGQYLRSELAAGVGWTLVLQNSEVIFVVVLARAVGRFVAGIFWRYTGGFSQRTCQLQESRLSFYWIDHGHSFVRCLEGSIQVRFFVSYSMVVVHLMLLCMHRSFILAARTSIAIKKLLIILRHFMIEYLPHFWTVISLNGMFVITIVVPIVRTRSFWIRLLEMLLNWGWTLLNLLFEAFSSLLSWMKCCGFLSFVLD